MKLTSFLFVAASLCLAGGAFAQEHRPMVAELLNQARQAETEGRHEHAENLRREARKQNQAAEKEFKPRGENPRDAGRESAAEQRREKPEKQRRERAERRDLRKDAEPRKQEFARSGPGSTDRAHHVGEAIMHLRKAGMSEIAQRIEQQARAGGGRPEGERPRVRQPRPGVRGAALLQHRQRVQERDRRMQELQTQMETMARELNELREQQKRSRGEG